ncbi:cell wall hydrolase [Sphingomonas sp. dw_22]|uniref:cell wall hydrolase n=1 Tax=Sphingomonas sp. dw_22 TaxID=2721175 RepID=UPI001BD59A72|nr:cell wall hydrolase [Sphingomonas sp. dw_22]
MFACAVVVTAQVFAPSGANAQSAVPLPVEDRAQAVECLTLAIAYEAGFESPEGQQAVAEVILNRVHHPAFPKSVCDVVFAGSTQRTGCQFTFTCDGSLRRRLPGEVFARARTIAEQALDGQLPARVGDAVNYHADYVSPYWAPKLERVIKIGAHIFYRRPGPIAGTGMVSPGATSELASSPATDARSPAVFAPWGLAPAAARPESDKSPGL